MIERVISGGQVGADIAGLRAAKACEIPTGGYAPCGWVTTKGPQKELLQSFNLIECARPGYPARTELNVASSDATIRFASNWNSPGELCTLKFITKYHQPFFDVPIKDGEIEPTKFLELNYWLFENRFEIKVLNVAGNARPEYEEVIEYYLRTVFNLFNSR